MRCYKFWKKYILVLKLQELHKLFEEFLIYL
jgi:hypothetical protein